MKRWLLLLPVFMLGLFVAFHATAATRDTNASSSIGSIGGGQYRWSVTQLSPDTAINSFTLVPGPALTITAVVSIDSPGSCTLSGRNVVCNVPLTLAPCNCQAGGSAGIVLAGSGDVAGSTLQVNGAQFPIVALPGSGTTTTTATTTTATTTAATTTTATPPPPPVTKPVSCVVPKLVGMTLAAAKAALRKAHCGSGSVQSVKSGLTKGRVVSSVPTAGHKSKAGTRIRLRVSNGRK